MYHRDINTLKELGNEIIYIDQYTMEERTGIVVGTEQLDENTVFVYVASPDKTENDKQEGSLFYRDIFVFDNRGNELPGGVYKDYVLGMYGKHIPKNK